MIQGIWVNKVVIVHPIIVLMVETWAVQHVILQAVTKRLQVHLVHIIVLLAALCQVRNVLQRVVIVQGQRVHILALLEEHCLVQHVHVPKQHLIHTLAPLVEHVQDLRAHFQQQEHLNMDVHLVEH